MSKNIPVWIKNTFAPEDHGTVIKNDAESDGKISAVFPASTKLPY